MGLMISGGILIIIAFGLTFLAAPVWTWVAFGVALVGAVLFFIGIAQMRRSGKKAR